MNALAFGTGGVMLPTSNDLSRMLARAVRDGSQYYTLSYTPTNTKTDGSFRRIEVKLRSGNYQLAYRRLLRDRCRAGNSGESGGEHGESGCSRFRRSAVAADAQRDGRCDRGAI